MCRAILLCVLLVGIVCAQTAPVSMFAADPTLPDSRYPPGTIGYNSITAVFEMVNPAGTAWLKLPPLPLMTPVATPHPAQPAPIALSPAPATPIPVPAATPPPGTSLPTDVLMLFGAYAPGGSPPAGGGFSYAKLVSTSQVIYSFSTYQSTLVKGKIQTSTTTGASTRIKELGPIQIFVYGQVGQATTTITSAAFAGGGNAFLQVGKTKWILGAGYEALKGTSSPQGTFKLIFARTN